MSVLISSVSLKIVQGNKQGAPYLHSLDLGELHESESLALSSNLVSLDANRRDFA